MLVAACLLFILGTMVCSLVRSMMLCRAAYLDSQHVIVDANHVWQGFISSGNADLFFEDSARIRSRMHIRGGDSRWRCNPCQFSPFPLLTRAYVAMFRSTDAMVWQRIEVIIIPIIGWLAVVGTSYCSTVFIFSLRYSFIALNQLREPTRSGRSANCLQRTQALFSWKKQEMGDLILLNGISYECSCHKLGFFQPLPTVESTDPSYLGILALRLWLVHRRSLGVQMTRSVFILSSSLS